MHFELKEHTNFLAVLGSHAYGMATENSDIDLRGICTPPISFLVDYERKFDQHDAPYKVKEYPFAKEVMNYVVKNNINDDVLNEPLDQSIYSLQKYFYLAKKANPNILEMLFVDPNEIIYCDSTGKLLLENRYLFLSKKVKFTYAGYAYSQLKRIKTHRRWLMNPIEKKPERVDFGLPTKPLLSAEQRDGAKKLTEMFVREWLLWDDDDLGKRKIEEINNKLENFMHSVLNIKDSLDLFSVADIAAISQISDDSNFIKMIQAEKKYKRALIEYKQYQDWKKNRNPERAKLEAEFSFDAKHASHLVRLMETATEVLKTGELKTKRYNADLLLDIRNGAWTYDYLIKWAEDKDKELDKLYKESSAVPKKPNDNKLRELYQACLNIKKS